MAGGLAGRLAELHAEFGARYRGSAHLREPVPAGRAGLPQASSAEIGSLHEFARANPIYSGSREAELLGERFTVYEGDISGHWIDSTKHDASGAPFYPTWLVSALALAREARGLGAASAVDVGAGDGRIAYCCALEGLPAAAIEIDPGLAALQRRVAAAAGAPITSVEADAARHDYAAMRLDRPALLIGGLPQVGELLAGEVVRRALAAPWGGGALFALAGGRRAGLPGGGAPHFGWGPLLRAAGLRAGPAVTLPTSWTEGQPRGTPYLFARRAGPLTGPSPRARP